MRISVSGGEVDAELAQHRARLAHGARAVLRRLVPGGRQPEHAPWVARAERAHDEVVPLVRVLDRAQVLGDEAADVQLARRRGGVLQQPLLERGIGPGARDDARSVQRSDVAAVGLDDDVDGRLAEQPLLDQQRFDGARAEGRVGVPVLVVAGSCGSFQAGSRYDSQRSRTISELARRRRATARGRRRLTEYTCSGRSPCPEPARVGIGERGPDVQNGPALALRVDGDARVARCPRARARARCRRPRTPAARPPRAAREH